MRAITYTRNICKQDKSLLELLRFYLHRGTSDLDIKLMNTNSLRSEYDNDIHICKSCLVAIKEKTEELELEEGGWE
mgnify:CR=1 FL=1